MKLSVVMPVYNEERTVEEIVRRVQATPYDKEIILVNDCSKDGTAAILERMAKEQANVRVFHHPHNLGKGGALATGFSKVTGDVVLIQDADLEYDPSDYPTLLRPILEGKADVVFGSRFLGGAYARVHLFYHYVGNRMLTLASNCFTNLNLTDMETCYKVFRRHIIDEITPKLVQKRFGFEPEVTARVARRKYRIYEISVSYSGRTYAEGKKIGWKDGIQAIWCIIRFGLAD